MQEKHYTSPEMQVVALREGDVVTFSVAYQMEDWGGVQDDVFTKD